MLQTEMSARALTHAEARQHSDQGHQNEGEDDCEFDHGESALNAAMPRHLDRMPTGDATRNYARFTLHGSPIVARLIGSWLWDLSA